MYRDLPCDSHILSSSVTHQHRHQGVCKKLLVDFTEAVTLRKQVLNVLSDVVHGGSECLRQIY